MIRVAIVDDHAIVRAGLRALLDAEPDMALVGEASNGEEAIALAASASIDVFLLDLSMGDTDGVALIRSLHERCSHARVLVLSMHATPEFVRPALRVGAQGYVVKGSGLGELVQAIRTVHAGERFIDPSIRHALENPGPGAGHGTEGDAGRLTPRERQVLRLIALGHTNRSIGDMLELSPKTVDAHRYNLMRKLDLHDVQALTRLAVRLGLVDG